GAAVSQPPHVCLRWSGGFGQGAGSRGGRTSSMVITSCGASYSFLAAVAGPDQAGQQPATVLRRWPNAAEIGLAGLRLTPLFFSRNPGLPRGFGSAFAGTPGISAHQGSNRRM